MLMEQDDEGYTSPSKDNNTNTDKVDFRTAKYDSSKKLRFETEACFDQNRESICRDKNSSTSFVIAWDEVAKLPSPVVSRHVWWDDVKYPFPYQISNYGTTGRNRTNLETKVFISDSKYVSDIINNTVWMIPFDNRHGHGHGDQQKYGKSGKYTITNQNSTTLSQSQCSSTLCTYTVYDLLCKNMTTVYISLNQFIDHVLHLMCGRESQSFSLKCDQIDDGNEFEEQVNEDTLPAAIEISFIKNSNLMVHGINPITLVNFCKPFLQCGSLYKRLGRLATADEVLQSSSCTNSIYQSSKRNAVFQSFVNFINNYLKLYQTMIMLKKDSLLTLTQLHAFMKPLKSQLHVLEQIVNLQIDGNVVELLTTLNNLLFVVESQTTKDLIRNLFISCASAYLRYIADWIFRGELGPPMEFHITRTSNIGNDRKFWTHQFTQKEVPVFLKEAGAKIFETGKALNLLITLQPLLNSMRTTSLFADSIEQQIHAECGFDDLKKLGDTWNSKLNSFCEENSHLVSEIEESIQEVISNTTKVVEVDLAVIEQKRINFHKRVEQLKIDAYQRDRDKKHELLLSLQNQIKQTKELKIQRKLKDQIEEEKIQEYVARKDKQHAEEKKKFSRKHFPRSSSDIDVCDSVISKLNNTNKPISESCSTLVQSKSEPASIVNICIVRDAANICNQNQKSICPQNRTKHSFSNKTSNITEIQMCSAEDDSNLEVEVKFDPENIITRDPQPYKLVSMAEFTNPILQCQAAVSSARHHHDKTKADQFCMNEFLSRSVLIPLMAQNKMVNSVLLHHMVKEKMLFHHLGMINNFLCLQNGMFGHFLCDLLIDEVKKSKLRTSRDLYEKSYRVNMILGEALSIALDNEMSDPLLKNINFSFVNGAHLKPDENYDSPKAKSEYQVLNSLRLIYKVEWPLNIILTEDMMSLYENIFNFLMKLIRAELLLERMFFHLKSKCSKSSQLFRLNTFRYRMLHFVRSVRNYVNITVIHTAWNELCSNFNKMDSMEIIYRHLVSHVKSIQTNCLLGPKAEKLMKLILSQLLVVESFCSQLDSIVSNAGVDWDKGKEISKHEFVELCQKYEVTEEYAKLFTESILKVSTKGIYTKVDNFLEHYNFNRFFQTIN